MAVRCLFFVEKQGAPCEVLEALGTPALLKSTQQELEKRYCRSGAFFSCPIFQNVERRLTIWNRCRDRLRRQAGHEQAAAS